MSWACRPCTLLIKERKFYMKRLVLLIGIVFSILSVQADENILKTIKIEPLNDTYNIVLVTDKEINVKKNIQGSNKINFDIKNVKISKELNTVYSNVSGIDSILAEQNKNGVKIFFQAKNAGKSAINFDTTTSLEPVVSDDISTKNTTPIDRIKVMSVCLLALVSVFAANMLKRRNTEYKVAEPLFNDRTLGLMGIAQQTTVPVFNKNIYYPYENIYDNYSEIKNEHPGFYGTVPSQFRDRKQNVNDYNNEFEMQLLPKKTAIQTITQDMHQLERKMTTPVNTAPVNQSNPKFVNLKFLESISEIYKKAENKII